MIKKAKKTNSIYKKIKRNVLRNKRENIIAGIVLVTLVLLLGIGAYEQYINRVDKGNVAMLHENGQMLINRIQNMDRDMVWKNESTCSVFRPRSFGETIRHSCGIHYSHTRQVKDQDQIDELIGVITSTLRGSTGLVEDVNDRSTGNVKLLDDMAQNSYYDATSFTFKHVNLDKESCYVRYVLSNQKDSIEAIIECTVSTRHAYFEPIEYR